LWSQLENKFSIHQQKWPAYDADLARGDEVEIAVQINGKTRDTVTLPRGAKQQDVEMTAKKSDKVSKHLSGEPKKVIFVADRIINFVV
jgi:leucyl-tRNA synthetase